MQGESTRVTTIDDHKEFQVVRKALKILGFSEQEVTVCETASLSR